MSNYRVSYFPILYDFEEPRAYIPPASIISYCRSKSPARSSKPSQSFRSATTLWRRGKYDSVVALNMSAVRLHMFSTPTEFQLVMQVAEQGPTDVP